MRTATVWLALILWAPVAADAETIRYGGSSTIGKFIADAGVEVVAPDARMLSIVAGKSGAIGHISFSFLKYDERVRALDVDGQEASVENATYPIARPLYLLTPGEPQGAVRAFIDWTLGPVGQAIVRGRFVGAN